METPLCPTITDLPASAQRVLADHLKPSDAASCRLASRLLAQVAPDRAATRLWVVANTFAAQMETDARGAKAAAGGGGALLAATSLARAAQGVLRAEVLVDASRTCREDVWQELFGSLLSTPTLQELTVTEYASTASKTVDDALTNRLIASSSEFSWSQARQEQAAPHAQTVHNSSSSSGGGSSSSSKGRNSSILTAADCAWVPALVEAANRRQVVQQQQQDADEDRAAVVAAAAAAASPQIHLTLQLLAPLLPQHCMHVVQLQGLAGLVVRKTAGWMDSSSRQRQSGGNINLDDSSYPDFPHAMFGEQDRPLLQRFPVLPTGMLRQLRSVPQLRSLSCTVGGPMYGEKPGEVGTKLQSLLSDHLPHLTHLSLGTVQAGVPGRPVHYSLSAPLRMPALASLTCNLGFSLDVESDVDNESTQLIQDSQRQGSGTGSSSGSREPRRKPLPDLLAALTQLILVEPACVADVIERATASKAVCSQLQHLELPELHFDDDNDGFDYDAPNDQQQQQARPNPAVATLQRLGQLSGLRQLATVVRGQWQLNTLVAAVGSQLQGLTMTCQHETTAYWPIDFDYYEATGRGEQRVQLSRLFVGMQQLTSLKIIGSTGSVLDPSRDLPVAAQHLTALRSLSYTGRVLALPSTGFDLQPGMLPPTLQGLTLVVRQSRSEDFDSDGCYTLHSGGLPEGLTSLKCRGFWWQRPAGVEPWSPWLGWECMPAGLRQLEFDCEAPLLHAGPGSILPVSTDRAVQESQGNAQPSDGGGNSSVQAAGAAQLLLSTSSWGSAVDSYSQQEEPPVEPPVADQAAAADDATAAAAVAVAATPEAAAAAVAAGGCGGGASGDSGCELASKPRGFSEAQPLLVGLPALETLALFVRANRHIEAGSPEPDRLPLAGLLTHLIGLTRLTHLHISSKASLLRYMDRCQGLSALRALKVLTLDVAPPASSGRRSFDGGPPGWPQQLISDLSTHLCGAAGLRVVRCPGLGGAAQPHLFEALAVQLPNCLVVEADNSVLDADGSTLR